MYRLYTQDLNREELNAIIAAQFDSFTTYNARGFYHGTPEDSLVIEIETQDGAGVEKIAQEIKRVNAQESVLLEEIPTKARLV